MKFVVVSFLLLAVATVDIVAQCVATRSCDSLKQTSENLGTLVDSVIADMLVRELF